MKAFITFFFFSLWLSIGNSQKIDVHLNELRVDGGRFNKKTNTVFADHLGFLWLGTDSGLYRYDGHTLLENQYDVFDQNSIPNNSINSIIEDDLGNLWIGSESYLIRYHRATHSFKGFYKNNTTTILGKSKDGTIWANLRNTGIIKITPHNEISKIEFQTQLNYLQKNFQWTYDREIDDYCEDLFGRHWFATPQGIWAIGSGNKIIKTSFDIPTRFLSPLDNNHFLAVTDKGIFLLAYYKNNFKLAVQQKINDVEVDVNFSDLRAISNDLKSNSTWLATPSKIYTLNKKDNQYLFSCINEKIENDVSRVNDNHINDLVMDSYNNLWIATDQGVKMYNNRNSIFDYINLGVGSSNGLVRSMVLDDDQRHIFLYLEDIGFYSYNISTKNLQLLVESKQNFGMVKHSYQRNQYLMGTGPYLLKSEKTQSGENIKIQFDTLKKYNKTVRDIISLNSNEIWVGLWGGGVDIISSEKKLAEFKEKVIASFRDKNVSAMHLDKKQNIWIGTRGDGLFKIDLINEQILAYAPKENGLNSNAILCFLEENARLWIGTRGGGLNLYDYDSNVFKNYGKKEGLASTTVAGITKNASGNIWLSTRAGISQFNVKEEQFVNFSVEDGVDESHFVFNSFTADQLGNAVFGCPGGFYTVSTSSFEKIALKPNTVITNYTIFNGFDKSDSFEENNRVKIHSGRDTTLTLEYDQNNIAFEFSSLDLTAPNKNHFAYKLDGVNDFWHYTKASNRNANYNDLPPGEYTFNVKSTNNDGIWNNQPTTINFKINPPFWKSKLAYTFYLILFALLSFIAYTLIKRWYRLKKKLVAETVSREKDNEINRMKMVFFTDISHELRTPLSLILGTIEKVVKERKFTLGPVTSQRIYNNTLRMHRLINQLMDIRKFDEGKIKLNISRNNLLKDVEIIKSAFNDFARIYEIDYLFLTEEKEIIAWYDVDILEKILFNLLSNAFKYTQKNGEIVVTLERTKESKVPSYPFKKLSSNLFIECTVKDNGIGIPEADLPHIFDRYYQSTKQYSNQIPGTGIGMELVQKLVEKHHGHIEVRSTENVFTEFTFYLPINKKTYHKKERVDTRIPLTKNFIKNSEYQVIEEISQEFDQRSKNNQSAKSKILLVEDNDELRQMVKDDLSNDYVIIEAINGTEGFEACISQKPDLIICDILMPVTDGISMLKMVKSNDATKSIPVFMLTAKNSAETKIECLSLGAEDYIEKPFSLEFVKWKVKNCFETRLMLKDRYSKVVTGAPSEVQYETNDEKFIANLVNIIENYMDDNSLNVEFLASEIGMSRANLYRKLQAINNETPVNFIKKIRLERAAQLLRDKNIYISEVAYMTGFSNQKYFSKCFQKEYGMSPRNYAKALADDTDKNISTP
ncbi:ATP-binding protein [Pseudozobellia sp. WGM2]|uniref:hybrid sensor histidine kinase/response regulator transcription factor n=1 Tax=Pseudozobellia sp. WGM2 TaxID=2787625 RepID=UPI001AE0D454|nr:ATP-binding protein [Pseudozobellia sp. WGM2]